MIRVDRGPEPAELQTVREDGLAKARSALAAGEAPDLTGYQPYRRPLRQAQRSKCAWCERWAEERFEDVEHYRPRHLYWWLTWTWSNLLFSCSECNRSWKRSQFPLARGQRLVAEQDPPGKERPLLLDPSIDDPCAHIQFRLIDERWVPLPRDGSRRGHATIEALGLNRDTLHDLYSAHVRSLSDGIETIRDALNRRDGAEISRRWTVVLESRLRANAPFAALTRDVLDHHFPKVQRERWGLTLPSL